MPEYKLYYFGYRGRAETIRLLFAAADQKYEDVRYDYSQWPEFKAKSPFGECPYLEVVEGSNVVLRLAQSMTIARYLARKFSLAGKDENEQAIVDMYADQLTDTTNHLVHAILEKDEAKKAEINKKLIEETLPKNLKFFEEQLQRSGSGFIAPSGITYVDAFLYAFLEWLDEKKPLILEKFPHIKAFDTKFSQIPSVAEWLQKRPVTKM